MIRKEIEDLKDLMDDMECAVDYAGDILKKHQNNPYIAYGIYIEKMSAFCGRLDLITFDLHQYKTIEQ
tara:strand:- start:54 stop:257 length:204 start_codon:yes stop_codon:yes gene_type:complete